MNIIKQNRTQDGTESKIGRKVLFLRQDLFQDRQVNSPRTGICAYEGGIIDKERDRIFAQK
jgi:hypothetical protein